MPIRFRDLSDSDFDPLNASKNKNVIKYNHTTGKFDTVSADSVLSSSENLPEDFVDVVESEVDVNNVTFTGIDGGSF